MKASVLFLLWYLPEPASYHPVGRLVRIPTDRGFEYEFVYLRAAEFVGTNFGFQPIAGGFADTGVRYLSDYLFPFFSNRVMSPSRLDYAAYLESLGLNPEPEDTLLILSRGANKATDRFETFEYPRFNELTGQLETFFWLRGIRYQPLGDSRCGDLVAGQVLHWVKDPQPVDPHAVSIFREPREHRIGFLPNYLTLEMEALTDLSAAPTICVERTNNPPVPIQQRVLCKLVAQWPNGYVPFNHEAMSPIPHDAWSLQRLMDPRTRELLQKARA